MAGFPTCHFTFSDGYFVLLINQYYSITSSQLPARQIVTVRPSSVPSNLFIYESQHPSRHLPPLQRSIIWSDRHSPTFRKRRNHGGLSCALRRIRTLDTPFGHVRRKYHPRRPCYPAFCVHQNFLRPIRANRFYLFTSIRILFCFRRLFLLK